MYQIGKLKLSQQALSVFIIGILMSIITFTVLRGTKHGMAIAFGYLLFTFYNTYTVNCLVVGNCKELAWILVALSALSVLIVANKFYRLV